MKGENLLLGLNHIDPKYIEEAEKDTLAKSSGRKRFRRPLLVAAIIALMLLLVGCGVVYVLKMQNLKMGEEPGERAVYSDDNLQIVGYEPVNQKILTLTGFKGTPGYQASQEWYEFKQEYDPDFEIGLKVLEEKSQPEFPEEYFAYVLYTQEMKDRLEEIMTKYSLKPLGYKLDFRTVQTMCTALGIEKFQTHQNDVEMKVSGGTCYSNGNFNLGLDFTLPTGEDSLVSTTWGNLFWYRKDCFCEDYIRIDDTGDWEEWNYTTASGDEVLIFRSPSDWQGYILCERDEAFLALHINREETVFENGEKGYRYLSDRQLELIADAIDFGIQPNRVSQEAVDNQAEAPDAATQDGYTVELKEVQTDGYVLKFLLGITAPEGTDISSHLSENREEEVLYNIEPSNWNYLISDSGEECRGTYDRYPQDDGDGLSNTQDFLYIIRSNAYGDNGPFAAGTTWNIHIEDLVHSYWDEENRVTEKEVLAEGEWNFTLTFSEENDDYREIELIQQPVTIQANVLMEHLEWVRKEVQVTSFKLRRFSASVESDQEHIVDFTYLGDGEVLWVVMKDGSRIHLLGDEGLYKAVSDIDLDQVDHVLMADGTKLELP